MRKTTTVTPFFRGYRSGLTHYWLFIIIISVV